MNTKDKIVEDLIKARYNKDQDRITVYSTILGEFQREKKKDLTEDEIISKLKKLKESELELLKAKNQEKSKYIEIIDLYLPKMASMDDIISFIKTIDFSTLKNKMQAIGLVTKHFGSTVDGSIVKSIIQKWDN